ncbi:hypothetical protein VN97_g8749 [Penicillium thymicola]|uniref:Uncharacterized protein n=1 Tax=Penicillium thymicola TaxID=293382 RepID=A0AAI9TD83_PENTH|nr:hypothetical protein VN97_g8749 [Penicillium thymicola]
MCVVMIRLELDFIHYLIGYCDADWAGPHSDKGLSTSGFIFKMAGGAVSWTSKKQPCVALSTTESEYIAEALGMQEAVWLPQLLTEIGLPGFLQKPICKDADSNGAIALASNPEFHINTKHIAIRCHRLREEVAAGNVKFVKIPTAEMAADGLTKPLAKVMFRRSLVVGGAVRSCDLPVFAPSHLVPTSSLDSSSILSPSLRNLRVLPVHVLSLP